MKVFDPNWSKEPKSDVRMSKQDEEASPMETNPQATPAAKPQKSRKRTAEEDARSTKKVFFLALNLFFKKKLYYSTRLQRLRP